ncbi:protein-S-isoprenylcysteine O-methyltransferase A-like isoform X2 [Iris pallida]|uniref:Protein-S-isoprenylcysteine O-methyltransferase n=1 Tax=Iris pallida TaxID=29817 RepID=A0AAX6GXI2_IRIPA|nr:protein-S-isoprenylcysteine O-methyltransferase A-like isoform X2 [Iris pallida]
MTRMVPDSIATAQLSRFLGAIFFFHGSEYALAVAFHGRSNVSLGSLLVSKEYVVAMACSLMEYLIEYSLFPELKNHWWFCNFGLLMVLLGEVIRKTAIITAGRSFTHNIRIYYEDEHELVTRGIYRFMRHPSYCGFFIWATGTQVMLSNPICIIAFMAVTWKFFSKRIPYEEFFLKQFFGNEYAQYAQKVPSGIPFLK